MVTHDQEVFISWGGVSTLLCQGFDYHLSNYLYIIVGYLLPPRQKALLQEAFILVRSLVTNTLV